MIKILSLDPGVTTGYSLAVYNGSTEPFRITCDQMKMSHRVLMQLLQEWKPKFLISESFEFRQKVREGLELYSRELIGMMHYYASMNPDCTFSLQTAAKGKGHFGDDNKLKRLDVYVPGRDHGRDAVRHLLQWWTFEEGYQFNHGNNVLLVREDYIRELADRE